jgi:hypothetical protein
MDFPFARICIRFTWLTSVADPAKYVVLRGLPVAASSGEANCDTVICTSVSVGTWHYGQSGRVQDRMMSG